MIPTTRTKNHNQCTVGHCQCHYDFRGKARKKRLEAKLMKFDFTIGLDSGLNREISDDLDLAEDLFGFFTGKTKLYDT